MYVFSHVLLHLVFLLCHIAEIQFALGNNNETLQIIVFFLFHFFTFCVFCALRAFVSFHQNGVQKYDFVPKGYQTQFSQSRYLNALHCMHA